MIKPSAYSLPSEEVFQVLNIINESTDTRYVCDLFIYILKKYKKYLQFISQHLFKFCDRMNITDIVRDVYVLYILESSN